MFVSLEKFKGIFFWFNKKEKKKTYPGQIELLNLVIYAALLSVELRFCSS